MVDFGLCYHPYSSIGHRTGPGGCFRLVENRYNPWSIGQHGTVRVAPSVLQGNQSNLGTHMAKKAFELHQGVRLCCVLVCLCVCFCLCASVCMNGLLCPFLCVHLDLCLHVCVCLHVHACACVCEAEFDVEHQ